MATGGFFTPYDTPIQQQLNDEELKAIMDTAHALGKTVTAHVYTNELMQKLIAFGIDGMEHGSLMNRETAQLIEEKGCTWFRPSVHTRKRFIMIRKKSRKNSRNSAGNWNCIRMRFRQDGKSSAAVRSNWATEPILWQTTRTMKAVMNTKPG
ncbi:MAG: amidohydrolase family protein [Lachnospiraceae bacterium]